MRVILDRCNADAIVKTGTWHGVIPGQRLFVGSEVGWTVLIRPADCPVFFRVTGEGVEYSTEEAIGILAEAERVGAESRVVIFDREPPKGAASNR